MATVPDPTWNKGFVASEGVLRAGAHSEIPLPSLVTPSQFTSVTYLCRVHGQEGNLTVARFTVEQGRLLMLLSPGETRIRQKTQISSELPQGSDAGAAASDQAKPLESGEGLEARELPENTEK